jgi:hypothetical protein
MPVTFPPKQSQSDPTRLPVDVVLWAITRQTEITWVEIGERWSVCRATAYRWLYPCNYARRRAQCLDIPRAEPTRAPVAMEARTQ